MKNKWVLSISLLAAMPLLAHHSLSAEYDLKKRTTIKGTVTKVEYMNPHLKFYIDAPGSDEAIAHWTIEVGAPGEMMRSGWYKNTIQQGDQISVVALPAKNGSKLGYGQTVTFSDGRVLSASGKTVRYRDGGRVTVWGNDLYTAICDQSPSTCDSRKEIAPIVRE